MPVRIVKNKDIETVVAVVLDCSGSMESIRDSVIDAFNEYVDSLKRKDEKYIMYLQPFSHQPHKPVYDMEPLNEVERLARHSYIPDGSTALYDTIGKAAQRVRDYKRQNENKKITTLFVIITDGMENSSTEFTRDKVKQMISVMEENEDSKFVYLAANQDAWAVGQSFGIDQMNAAVFVANAKGVEATMDWMSATTSSYRASSVSGTNGTWAATTEKKTFGE